MQSSLRVSLLAAPPGRLPAPHSLCTLLRCFILREAFSDRCLKWPSSPTLTLPLVSIAGLLVTKHASVAVLWGEAWLIPAVSEAGEDGRREGIKACEASGLVSG